MVKYNESIYFNRVLYKQDILGSISFARANAKSGIITQEEFEKVEEGLRKVEKEWETDTFEIIPAVDEYEPRHISRPPFQAAPVLTRLKGYPHYQRATARRDHRQEHRWKAPHWPKPQRAGRLRYVHVAVGRAPQDRGPSRELP